MRKVWLGILITVLLIAGSHLIITKFSEYASWLNLDKFFNSAVSKSGYTNQGDMNRLTSFGMSLNRFLDTWLQKLFGLGLGNCDRAEGFEFLTSPFYRQYGWLHYDWFMLSFVLLETGLVGLAIYIMFFVLVFVAAGREEKKCEDPTYCQMGQIIAVICPILVVYDSSLRIEIAYLIYFALALPFLKKGITQKTKSYKKA